MTILTLQPDATAGVDTYINASSQTSNYGVTTFFNVVGPASTARTLIKFDLSGVPAGAVITSAILTLQCSSVSSTSSVTINIHRALTDWYEGNANAGTPTGSGSTWQYRNHVGSVQWGSNTAGGLSGTDFSASVAANTAVTTVGAYTWDLTSEVDAMVNGGVTNRGWWIKQDSSSIVKTFSSSDNSTASSRPKLEITYVVQEIDGTIAGTCTVTGAVSGNSNPSITTVSSQPDGTTGKDTLLSQNGPTNNYGVSTTLVSGYTAAGLNYKTLIQFDLSFIPAGIQIISATLRLYCTSEGADIDQSYSLRRSLVEWYEGTKNGTAPSGGEDASTWNLRNTNGSVAWGSAGGLAGTDYASSGSETSHQIVSGASAYFDWEVGSDIVNFLDSTYPNYGWWLIAASFVSNNGKTFISSDNATAAQRPELIIYYYLYQGEADGTSTVTGSLSATGYLRGTAAGTADADNSYLGSNQNTFGLASGSASVSGTIFASGYVAGNSFGDSTASSDIKASYHSVGSATGTSSHVADIKGRFYMEVVVAGIGSLTATPSFQGQMRGAISGDSTTIAVGYARAVNVALVIGCNPVPYLYITDGSVKPNGQLNILDFLGDRAGYFLVNYRPQIFQYKDGGYWSSSPQSNGRQLRGKVFDNVVDVLEVAARAGSQDALIQYQQDLLAFQEAASDYWANDYSFLPFYLVAKAARETNARYAAIYMISCPELNNPYTQPFFDDAVGATFTSLTIRIEHGLWKSKPPGRFDCVEVSGQREWTVSGWQTGS